MFTRTKTTDFPYFAKNVRKSNSIEINDLKPGCQKPDCIISIDQPRWITKDQILSECSETEEILLMFVGTSDSKLETYAFPITILDYHEIVNFETASDDKVAVTYCPLCQTATAYSRNLQGNVIELGVSGLLYNSALVMFDRKSMSLFSQVWSKGIIGKYTDLDLEQLPLVQTTVKRCSDSFPDTKFLSHDTGFEYHQKRYGSYPYTDYKTTKTIKFPISIRDDLLHPKELVYIVEERFFKEDTDKTFFFKISDLMGLVQHTSNFYSRVVAGGRLFFVGKSTEGASIDWKNWIPNGISFYFSARSYFPHGVLK